MTKDSKLMTYLGFSIKSGNLVKGINAVNSTKRKIYLLLTCSEVSDNSLKEIKSIANKRNTKLFRLKELKLQNLVNKENCKLVAVLDENLAKAILEYCQIDIENIS